MERKLREDFWTLPNAISLVRLIFGAPVTLAFYIAGYDFTAWIFALFVLTDAEGFLARWQGSESKWGIILDPVADQCLVLPIIWYFWWHTNMPLEVPLALSVRELFMFFVRLKANRNIPSIFIGKLKTSAEYTGIFLILSGGQWVYFCKWLMIAAMFLAAWSFLKYLQIAAEASDAGHSA